METNSSIDYPILPEMAERWSPRTFDPTALLSDQQIGQLFEAARWAPSAFNEQPWRYVCAARQEAEAFSSLLDCLVPKNAEWAGNASLLIAAFSLPRFKRNDRPNRHYLYDTGQANFALTVEAMSMGLFCHQMAGFDPDKASSLVDEDWEPAAFIAVGRLAAERPGEGVRLAQDGIVRRLR